MSAVAGLNIPADERRSPLSWSISTRSRSWSILIGSLSATSRLDPSVGGDLAEHADQQYDADHSSGHLEDVRGARLPGAQVDEVALERGDLATGDGLWAAPVEQLRDGVGQPFARGFHLGLERGGLQGHGRRLSATSRDRGPRF